MTPTLNWREIAELVRAIAPGIQGAFVDRIVVPARPSFPGGYVKSEWAIRLGSRKSERTLLFSVRPRHPYLTLLDGRGPKAAEGATHSPFSLALSKHLKGAKLLSAEALPRERVVILWFAADRERLGLVLSLIPALPEALLVRDAGQGPPWQVLARSRATAQAQAQAAAWTYSPPDGSRAPDDLPLRAEWFDKEAEAFAHEIERGLDAEAFGLRLAGAQRELRDLLKQTRNRVRQSETALREAENEADWKSYGDRLKPMLGAPPPLLTDERGKAYREVVDFETGEASRVPGDPQLTASQQVEKFYQFARRKARRAEEAGLRLETFREAAARFERWLAEEIPAGDWKKLEALERASGAGAVAAPSSGTGAKKPGKFRWLGKTFVSKDGMAIWVGRSRDENLELTFKHARGNDVWMHIRGKPGAHVLVPVPSGKSAPLDTLLDAAQLAIHYSGGSKWGKTEVDYTFKKYVKRIRDSTEASYTNNKTLLVEPDPQRLQRLLGGSS